MSFPEDRESNLDRAIADVAGEPIDPKAVEQAASRVWAKLAAEAAAPEYLSAAAAAPRAGAPEATAHSQIRSCADFQREIPAYLAGELPPARALLVEDHTRSCIACHRSLRAARWGEPQREVAAPAPSRRFALGRRAGLALAASLAAAVGLSSFLYVREVGFSSGDARVESIEGQLLQVDDETVRPVAAGAVLAEGEQVRTAKGSHAVLRLGDGSLIEMADRAALSYDERRSGTTVDLAQGRIIVQAAKQQEGRHLYVATDDCRVAVVGTIFSVNHGTKGSRVSVVEGRVKVDRSGREDLLTPGQQVTTRASVATVPVAQEVAWSANSERYKSLLAELTALGRDIDRQVARPGLRTSTRLLDLAPAGTMIYVALPNLAASLADTQRLLDQRLAENPQLAQWWGQTVGTGERAERFHETLERLGTLGRYLGDEVAVAVTAAGPVVLAEVRQPAAFRAALEQEAARLAGEGKPVLRLVESPAAAQGHDDALLAWISGDLLVATPKPALLTSMAAVVADPAANPFRASAFHAKLAAAYGDGAGWLFGGDLKTLMRHEQQPGEVDRTAENLGVLDLDHVIIDRHEGEGGTTETRAIVSFDRPRRGLASWLAAPGPMGTLDFISPDANAAAAFVVRDPASLLDDLLTTIPDFGRKIEQLRAEHGFDLRELAAGLGGEIAFALDGPLLPKPSWKLVAEVYDPARLERALADLARGLDAASRAEGHGGVTLSERDAGGRTYYSLVTSAGPEAHWVIADGYLIVAPSPALLEQTLRQRAAGNTLAASARFQELLPEDRQINFSALVYHQLGSLLDPVAGAAGRLAAAGPNGGVEVPPAALLASGPGLTYAYGEEDRILFSSKGQSPLGLNLGTLIGLGGLMGDGGPGGR